jgi:hypothetical protein
MCCADPFANDESFLLSMLSLEELGATGNKVCGHTLSVHCAVLYSTSSHVYCLLSNSHHSGLWSHSCDCPVQGLVGIISNPVLANGVAGLATSATAQATIEVGHPHGRPLRGEAAYGK